MGGSVKDVKSKAELDNITKSGEAVIIHFWASWCDASKQMDQVFSHLSTDFPNTHFLAVEAEEQPEISEAFSVSSVPYFAFVKDGKTVDTLEGADPSSLANKVARVAGSANPGEPAAPASLGMAAGPTVLETVKKLAKEYGSSPQANQARPGLSDALKNRLQQLVASHPIMLFMKGNPEAPRCGFSQKVIDILKDETVKFGTFDILSDIEVREGLKLFSNWPTFPQLHCKGELLGGCDIAIAMHESGELREIFRDHGIDTIDSVEAKISGSENGKGGITQSTGLSTTLTSRLESLVNSNPVMLFMKGKPTEPKCGFSGKVVAILQEEKVAFESFDILTDEEVRQGLKVYSNWSSYPHLYIKDECWPWGDEHAADIQASLEWGDDGGEEVDGGHGGDDEEEGDGDELTGSGQNGFGNEGSGQNDSGDEDRLDGNGDEIRMEEITAGIASGAEIAEVDSGEVAIAESRSAADVNPLDFTDGNYTSAARRPRQRPAWLSDYEYGEGLSDEEYQGNFALYVDADPVSYEVAAQSSTWKCAMEAEIAAIQKNNTWVLTDLPRGATRVGVCDDPGIN